MGSPRPGALVALVGILAAAPLAVTAGLPVTDLERAGATNVHVAGDWLAAGEGSVWLSDGPTSIITRLDPSSGAPVATVAVPQMPCEATEVAFGSLWTATSGRGA